MIPWPRRDNNTPRQPLASRLIGLAVGVLSLSLALSVALHVVVALIPVVVPLIVLMGIYSVILGKRHK